MQKTKRELIHARFLCPAKGDIEFNVWKNPGELITDACWRGLRKWVDPDQVPFCRLIRYRTV